MRRPGVGVTISFQNLKEGASITQERRGPDEEAIDAFVHTFRYFIQNNESISFQNMEKHYSAAPIDAALQREFVKLRKEINEYLDEKVGINYNNEDLTRRRVMDVFVYGGFSHANEGKRRLYKTWMDDPVMARLIEQLFIDTLADIHNAIVLIKRLNEQALKSLPGPS